MNITGYFFVKLINKQWNEKLIRLIAVSSGVLTHCGLVTPYGDRFGSTFA